MDKEHVANVIKDLYLKFGDSDYIGEEVTQLEHAIQTAMLAEKDNMDTNMILAAFLHDIGHLLILQDKSAGHKMKDFGCILCYQW